MHSYLRAVGFSNYNSRKQLESIYSMILRSPNRKTITTVSVDNSLIQFEKDFGQDIGLTIVGDYDNVNGNLSVEHYFPYIKGENFIRQEHISIEKQTDKESYAGVCEDYRLSMTIIFYVLNIADYAKSKWLNYSNRNFTDVKFSGLSISGTVLLGVNWDEEQITYAKQNQRSRNRLLSKARTGDTEAINTLTINEMNTYSSVTRRIKDEDILSIVDTSFMPCGVECDHYMVIGNILKVKETINTVSKETVYNLLLKTNDIILNVGINKLDLQGEPLVGRRFRGEVWLQGFVRI